MCNMTLSSVLCHWYISSDRYRKAGIYTGAHHSQCHLMTHEARCSNALQLCLEHLHPFAHFARNSNPVHLHVHIIVERDMRTLEYIFTLYAHLLMDYRLFGSTVVVAYKSVDVFWGHQGVRGCKCEFEDTASDLQKAAPPSAAF